MRRSPLTRTDQQASGRVKSKAPALQLALTSRLARARLLLPREQARTLLLAEAADLPHVLLLKVTEVRHLESHKKWRPFKYTPQQYQTCLICFAKQIDRPFKPAATRLCLPSQSATLSMPDSCSARLMPSLPKPSASSCRPRRRAPVACERSVVFGRMLGCFPPGMAHGLLLCAPTAAVA